MKGFFRRIYRYVFGLCVFCGKKCEPMNDGDVYRLLPDICRKCTKMRIYGALYGARQKRA